MIPVDSARDPGEIPRWRAPLVAGLAALALLAGIRALVFDVPAAGHFDAVGLASFWMLQRLGMVRGELGLVHTVDPLPFAVVAVILVALAARRGWPLLIGIVIILTGANLTTLLVRTVVYSKGTLILGFPLLTARAYPSTHSTACMSLVLCALLVAPTPARRAVALVGSVYAIAFACSQLVLADHYPSDVIGGFMMAASWTFIGVAGVGLVDRQPRHNRSRATTPRTLLTPLSWVLALTSAGTAVAIVIGPKTMAPLTFAVTAALIGASAVLAVGVAASLVDSVGSAQPVRLRSARRRRQEVIGDPSR